MTSRYHRQKLLPELGAEGQARLASAHAAVVGVGALGCTSADLLVRAGVGRVTLIDRDIVETTNLQRQTLYTEADAEAGLPKAVAAAGRLRAVNSAIRIDHHVADANASTIERLLVVPGSPPDAILDGTDNFDTRLLINDVACKHGIAYFYAGGVAGRGMAAPVLPGDERGLPCLRCLMPEPPPPGSQPTCDTAGVFGPAIVIAAAVQAGEAIKLLAGRRDLVSPTLLEFDLLGTTRRRLDLAGMRDPACPCCVDGRHEFLDAPPSGSTALCGSGAVQVLPAAGRHVDLAALARRLEPVGRFDRTPFFLRGKLNDPPQRLTVFADGRALFHDVDDPARARALYARFIGT